MLQIHCQCGKSLKVPESAIGHSGKCPFCHSSVRIIAPHYKPGTGGFEERLIVAQGPAREGEQFVLGGPGPIEIGKLQEKPIFLPGKKVSRSHCLLVRTKTGWRIEDQGSTNGFAINGEKTKQHELSDGDVIQVGEYLLQFQTSSTANDRSSPANPKAGHPSPANARRPSDDNPGPDTLHDPIPPRLEAEARSKKVLADADDLLAANMYDVHEPDAGATAVPDPAEEKEKAQGPTCPGCGKTFSKSVKICVECGIDLRTGKTLLTSSEDNLDEIYASFEPILWLLSWPVPWGFFPFASEALGVRRPYFTWAITAITILISVGVWIGEAKDLVRGTNSRLQLSKHLMLWCGQAKPSIEEIEYTDWRYGDRQKFDLKVEEIKSRVEARGTPNATEERIYQKALADLSPQDRYYGEFEPSALFTSAFLHGGILHLVGNMLFLLVIGGRVNAVIGNLAMVFVYPLLAAMSALIFMMTVRGDTPHAYLGASGAIMGLAGMYLVLMPLARVHTVVWRRLWFILLFRLHHKVYVGAGYWILLIWVGFDVLYIILTPHSDVAHWAHLGGFFCGMALGLLLLVTRLVNARSGDLLTAMLGQRAWKLIGKPDSTRRSPIALF